MLQSTMRPSLSWSELRLFYYPAIVVGVLSIAYYLLGLLYIYGDFPVSLRDASREDLVTYYRIGEMLASGQITQVFDLAEFHAGLQPRHHYLLALNPPHFFFVNDLFYVIGYPASKVLILLVTVASAFSIGWMAGGKNWRLGLLVVISALAAYSLISLNISIVVSALIIFAVLYAGRFPVLAGVALALATVKPQYGLLIPIYLIVCGYWRAFFSAAIVTVLLISLSVVVYGPDAWLAFVTMFSDPGYQNHVQGVMNAFMSIHHALAKLGAPFALRMVAQATVVASCLAIVIWGAKRWSLPLLQAVVLFASALVSPSLFCYDWAYYYAAILILMRIGTAWPIWFQLAAAYIWCQPALKHISINLSPVVGNYYTASLPLTNLLVFTGIIVFFGREKSGIQAGRNVPHPA